MVAVGTSGWSYKHWRDVFYPPGLKPGEWLAFYTGHFSTVELNASFYRLPTEAMVSGWAAKSPPTFRFAIKGSRLITHLKRLRDCDEPLAAFFHRMAPLREKSSAILWQLPPSFHREEALLADFLDRLAAGWRHTVEFRHPSWLCDEVYQVLAARNVALCAISLTRFPEVFLATADFVYVRFHGLETTRYRYNYSEEDLAPWADWLAGCGADGTSGYAYFNNDVGGHAVANAKLLRQMLHRRGSEVGSEASGDAAKLGDPGRGEGRVANEGLRTDPNE